MRRIATLVAAAMVLIASRPHAQTTAAQATFKGGTDLVQVDVSVLDGKRRPVRGLTAADFTVFEDGKPREIQAFSEVYLPDRVRADVAAWVRDVPSDVALNHVAEEEGRLVLILLDRTIPTGEPSTRAKRIAEAAVKELGPDDLAAVLSTSNGATQNLTSDRTRLLRAINESDVSTDMSAEALAIMNKSVELGVGPPLTTLNDGRCLCGLCVLETITRAADAVQNTSRRRKVMLFIGSDLLLQSTNSVENTGYDVGCETRLKDARKVMFEALERSNLTVHSLDPVGLVNVGPVSQSSSLVRGNAVSRAITSATNDNLQRQGALRVLPDKTGGRAVMNTNGPEVQVPDIFRESDSYYLVGFRPADPTPNGKFHEITVKANRRGLDVHARSGYTATAAAQAEASTPNALTEPLQAAMTGSLPNGSLPVDLHAATFAAPGSNKAAVVLTVGVSAFASLAGATGAAMPLEVVASAYDRRGVPVGTARQPLELSRPSGAPGAPGDEQRFDVLSRLDLKPGEYELRIGVSGAQPVRTASVFSYVTVPPFDSAPLSLSSIVLGATAGTLTGPKGFVGSLLPVVPTARRDFARAGQLVGFLRIYQGTNRKDALRAVQLRSSITDEHGKVVANQSSVIEPPAFENGRAADHYLALPLTTLAPGDYLLQVEAEVGERRVGRAVRFTVK